MFQDRPRRRIATDARKRRRQGAPPPDRPARHRAGARRRTGAARHPQCAGRPGHAWHATAGPHRFAERARPSKASRRISSSGSGEIRSVSLFAGAGDEPAGVALAIDPARHQGRRQRRRQAHRRDALCGHRQTSCSKRSTGGSASLPPISRAAAASRSRLCSKRSMTRCAGCVPRSTCRRSRHGASSSPRSAPKSPRLLSAEIELTPGRVRRLFRPRPCKEIRPGSRLDADEVAETEALIGFVGDCRNYASELAINEVTQRTFNELQQFLDTGTRTLLDALRHAERRRPQLPAIAGRCRGAVLRQGVRPGIRRAAGQGGRGRRATIERKAAPARCLERA